MTVGAKLVGASPSLEPWYLRTHRTSAAMYQVLLGFAFLGSAFAGPLSHLHIGVMSGQGLLTVLLAMSSFALLVGSWHLRAPVEGYLRPLAAFTVWVVASLSWSPAWRTGSQNVLVWATFVALLLVSVRFARVSRDSIRLVARLLVVSSGVAAVLYAISLASSGMGSDAVWGNRTFAQFALLGLSWFLAGWRCRCRHSLLAAIVMAALIALSLSRTAFAAAVVLFFLAPFVGATWKRRALMAPAAVICLAFLVMGVLRFVEPLSERFGGDQPVQGILDGSSGAYTSGRVVMWTEVWQSAAEAPWIGKGAGSASSHLAEIFDNITHPHNDYLRILHDYGVVGLLVFLYGSLRAGRLSWLSWTQAETLLERRLSLTAFLALSAIAMMMVTDNTFVYVFVMAPVAILLGTTLGRAGGPDNIWRSVASGRTAR